MKIQTPSSKHLAQTLAKAQKCINTKSTIAILSSVLLQMKKDGKFYLTASTGEAQLTIPAPLAVIEGKFDKPVALPVDVIAAFLGTLPDCPVTFHFVDDHTLNMEYCTTVGDQAKEGRVSVPYQSGEGYPFMAQPTADCTHIVLPMQTLANAVSSASGFTAKEELRPQMCCMGIDIAEDYSEVVFVASDGHSLFKVTHSNNPQTGGSNFYRSGKPGIMLIHSSYFRGLSAFDDCEEVDVEHDGNVTRISSGDHEYLCKNVEGKYPNYRAVIPKGNPYYICFDKKEMLAVLKRIAIFGDTNNNIVEMQPDGMFVNVSAKNVDFARAADDQVMITDSQCASDFRIGFAIKTMTGCLNALPDGTIRMQMSEPNRAAILTADDPAATALTMCMPVVLQD